MNTLMIPEEGVDKALLLEQMRARREEDINWHGHRAFSLVFHQNDAHAEFLKEAHGLFFEGNGLNPLAFKSLKQFEHEVVRMTAALLHGNERTVGAMTSGGTESILLAVKTYRDHARAHRPWIRNPEMVVPASAHVAFDKAGSYFDVRMVHAPLDGDLRVNVDSMRRLITPNTIALVGSAPCYPFGVVDDIEALSDLARAKGIGLHVDACVGGFLLPWIERLGYPLPPFDFRVPGVTSISADLHKYGYAAKGASVILYRGMDYLRHQFFVQVDWPGGVYASPSIPGTRPGGAIAAAWAALMAMGENGYLQSAATTMETAARFISGINDIPGLRVLGTPPASVFAFTTTEARLDCYAVADLLALRGWHVDRQQRPPAIHLMINPGHQQVVDQYLEDLRQAVDQVRRHPEIAQSGSAPAYGLLAGVPARRLVAKNVLRMMESMYGPQGQTPNLSGPVPWPARLLLRLGGLFRER
ncbi:MAG: aspartate aminotransferase family protein [Candidatus Hydrogenedentes bacterium]|nr:aspartate aminotransferase family protein [Candidatus Hydrogenedentota bacterium]